MRGANGREGAQPPLALIPLPHRIISVFHWLTVREGQGVRRKRAALLALRELHRLTTGYL